MVPMMKEPLSANFMLEVPLASVPAVEMCWLQGKPGVQGKHGWAEATVLDALKRRIETEERRLAQSRALKPQLLQAKVHSSRARHQPAARLHLSSAPGMMISASDTL